jgi:general secretion pathway protein K
MMLNILSLLTGYTQWRSKRTTPNQQSGVILIIVLWFLVIVTAMVATLASETRLSAQIVHYNKLALQNWNDTLKALAAAQMELLINTMPDPPGQGQQVPLSERKNKQYRFDGRVLDLAYPIPDTVTVRIYDEAGKINIQRLSPPYMRQLLEKRLGKDSDKIAALLDAWEDWSDPDDLKRTNGAEKDYYETLSPPYEPRNAQIETVEELLLIKGFAEAFKGVEIDTAFTIYGYNPGINPNLATREALMLLPGLNEDLVNTILTKRREKEFKTFNDFNEFMQPEQLAELKKWIHFAPSNIYTIAIQTKNSEAIDEKKDESESSEQKTADNLKTKADNQEDNTTDSSSSESEQQQQRAYLVTVQLITGNNQKPKILMVNPYGILPDTRHEALVNQDDKSGKKPSTSENSK